MEKRKKKKNNKPIFILLGFLLIFGVFIYGITRPSQQSEAIKEIQVSFNKEDVKNIFYKYKTQLTGTDDNGETIIDEEFLQAVRKRLHSFNLKDEEIIECLSWLPPAPTSLNVIIVPDLSKRIIDDVNNPDQINNDLDLLKYIWKSFEHKTKFKMNSKDRLIVDVTDEGQAGGQFRNFANNLIFDLSGHRGQSNRLYFDKIDGQFDKNIEQLYNLAKHQPIGADYWHYFNRNLSKHIQKTTLFDSYRNVIIILTDGYLEAEHSLYTGSYIQRKKVSNKIKSGNTIEESVNSIISIPNISNSFYELEVLILEVKDRKPGSIQEPRDPGTQYDYDILKYSWTEWFKKLKIKNVDKNFFIQRNDATQLTKREIDKFLE